jgi:hypothetical protein
MTAFIAWLLNFAAAHIPMVIQVVNFLFNLLLTFILLPVYRNRKVIRQEMSRLKAKQHLHHTEVLGCGVINGVFEYEPLGGFDTEDFGKRVPDLIYKWNDGPSEDMIDPVETELRDQVLTVLRMNVAPFVHRRGKVADLLQAPKRYETDGGRYLKMIICLVRPDADKVPTLHDSPRAIIIEEGALRRIHELPIVPDAEDPLTGETLLKTLKLVASKYFAGDLSLILVLRLRLRAKCPRPPA